MPSRNIHSEPFDEKTLVKLDIFGEYARKWVPTFSHKQADILIVDAYAGPGQDNEDRPGSPLRILNALREHQQTLSGSNASVRLVLNDSVKSKIDALKGVIVPILEEDLELARVVRPEYHNGDALELIRSLFAVPCHNPVLLLLDQNGIKALSEDVIEIISQCSRLDLLMFCSTSYIGRFGETDEYKNHIGYIDVESIRRQPVHMQHRELTRQLRLHFSGEHHLKFAPFSIRKGSNTYGVIFGSHHYAGIEKFLDVAWRINPLNGEAEFDIDGDAEIAVQGDLFNMRRTKRELFEADLRRKLMNGDLRSNLDVYLYTLQSGFLPMHATEALRRLRQQGTISFKGRPLVSGAMYKQKRQLVYEVTHESE